MKTFAPVFWDPIAAGSSTLCTFWHVKRYGGAQYGWVEHPNALVIDGVTYLASTGLEVSNTENTDTLAVPTVDVTAFLDVSTEAELLAGVWNGAEITIFEGDYTNLPVTFDITRLHLLRFGRLGQVTMHDTIFRAELRGLTSRLETMVGRVTTADCPWIFGSVECLGTGDGGDPTINMADFTFGGTVTSLGGNPRRLFSASALTQHEGAFALGTITFTSGLNLGTPPMDIRTWRGKQFVMQRPLPYDVAVGDTFTAVLGDNKTIATCRDVFNNLGQYAGWAFLPGIFKMLQNDATRARRRPASVNVAADGNPENMISGDPWPYGDTDGQSDAGE